MQNNFKIFPIEQLPIEQNTPTALMHAVAIGSLEQVTEILASDHHNINARDNRGQTALDLACNKYDNKRQHYSFDILKALLLHPDIELFSALRAAIHYPSINADLTADMIKTRINAENVNIRAPEDHYTPLMYAVKADNVEAVNYLLGLGADVTARGSFGRTTSFLARDSHIGVLKLLLMHPDTNLSEALFITRHAAGYREDKKSYTKLFEELLKTRANNENLPQDAYPQALNLAVQIGSSDSVKILLANASDPNICGWRDYYTTLEFAIINYTEDSQRNEILNILLEHQSIDLNQYLREAIQNFGAPEIIEKLLTHPKVNVTTKDAKGKSALYYAYRFRESINLLLDNPDIDVNAHLREAIRHFNVDSVEKLLKNPRINFKAVDENGKAILNFAKQMNHNYTGYHTEKILEEVKKAVKSRQPVSYYFNELLEDPGKIKQAIIEAVDYCYKAIEAAVSMILQPFKNLTGYIAKPVSKVAPSTQNSPAYRVAQAPIVQEGHHVQRHEARAAAHQNYR